MKADKNFDVESILQEKGIELNLPPFLQGSLQFTAEQVQ